MPEPLSHLDLTVAADEVEDAVERVCAQWGVDRDAVQVDVLEDSEMAEGVVRVRIARLGQAELDGPADTLAGDDDEDAQRARQVVLDLLERMDIPAEVHAGRGEPDGDLTPIVLDVQGPDLGLLIGRKGETLSALQYLARLIVAKQVGHSIDLVVDVQGHKKRREEQLRRMAQRMAEQAVQRQRVMTLEPMAANERRIIHLALRDHPGVTTESVGEGYQRKVTIVPRASAASSRAAPARARLASLMAERAVHYLTIGHVAKDLTPTGHTLGGTVSFASLTAIDLDYTPGIVTAHAGDVDLSPLAGLPLAALPSPATTTFENIYSAGGRTQFLRARAAPLTADAVPLHWLRTPLVHLGPLAREVDYELAAAFSGSFLGLTPQGWLRQWDAEGRVQPAVVDWPEGPQVLGHASAVVLSIDDLGGDWAVAEQWAKLARVLVVTQGAEGCTVFVRGQGARTFRGAPQVEVDPTGAGDIFAAAYFINYYETDDPWASAKFANQMAGISVTRPGLAGVPTREEAGYCRTRAARG